MSEIDRDFARRLDDADDDRNGRNACRYESNIEVERDRFGDDAVDVRIPSDWTDDTCDIHPLEP